MGVVYVVHCVDTEGPLDESLSATFDRIYEYSGVKVEPTRENLIRIQNKELILEGVGGLSEVFSERLLDYNKSWTELDQMLEDITSDSFRNCYLDSEGKGWRYTWFVVDHVDYIYNPRNKMMGYHAIWDHYQDYFKNLSASYYDEFQWHAHPMSIYKESNKCGTSYINSPHIFQSLARRLIDRGFFPEGFRAGFHTERADSNWFLEQFIPYDFSNQSIKETSIDIEQKDLSNGRTGDWRRAVSDWSWYHPSHDDYQSRGNCHRYIFRCLNVGTRIRLLTQNEVDKAFQRASMGKDTLLAFCDHDFRNMRNDINEVYDYIIKTSKNYPDVKWINSTAVDAAKKIIKDLVDKININVEFKKCGRNLILNIITSEDSFGSQPFFAVKLKGGEYRIENLDIQRPNREWTYTFDDEFIHPEDIDKIGIATNSRHGSGALKVIGRDGKLIWDKTW